MTLADRILAWLQLRGVTQADLAKAAKVSRGAVNAWVRGVEKDGKRVPIFPTQTNLEAVVARLGLTMPEFYGAFPTKNRRTKAAA